MPLIESMVDINKESGYIIFIPSFYSQKHIDICIIHKVFFNGKSTNPKVRRNMILSKASHYREFTKSVDFFSRYSLGKPLKSPQTLRSACKSVPWILR